MAGLEGAHADEGYANTGGSKDGPVLTMMSKRLRALRKKYNRILQIEDNKAQGKTVNKEQEDVLKSKISVAALIDEYEKLIQPLLVAVREEVAEHEKDLMAATLGRSEEEDSVCEGQGGTQPLEDEEVRKETANGGPDEADKDVEGYVNGGSNGGLEREVSVPESPEGSGREEEKPPEAEKESILREYENESSLKESVSIEEEESMFSEGQVADLLKLLYFAHLFDVRSQGEASSLVWTKVHERNSCLSYDFVTDDATTPLIEGDLDALSLFGVLLTSRPTNVTLSHRDALQRCIKHARDWLLSSDHDIHSDIKISYSRLRERLNRVLSSEYFTMTPELQTVSQQTAAAAAIAAGQYLTTKEVENNAPPTYYSQQFGSHEEANVGSIADVGGIQDVGEEKAVEQPTAAVAAGGGQPQTHGHYQHYPHHPHHPQPPPQTGGAGPRSGGGYQQVHPAAGSPVRGRGMGGGYPGNGGRAGGRGYPNGRGGRGGRGGMYSNGGRGGQFYDQPSGFHPRPNHYEARGGRGGRGDMMYNGHSNGPAPPSPAVATGSG